MKIFVFGSSGFIGKNLLPILSSKHEVSCLAHKTPIHMRRKDLRVISGDALNNSWHEEMATHDVIINLCGNNIARNWTKKIKEEIRASRIDTTKNIVNAMHSRQTLINASAIGYYGSSLQECFDENSPPGEDFLAQITYEWEEEALRAQEKGCRVIIMRMGAVLGKGGALESMTKNFQKFLGGKIGSGNQYFSWIHINDLVDFICETINNNNYNGIYNLCSPNPIKYSEFNEAIGQILPRTSLKIPDFLLRATLGEFAKTILEGQQVIPLRLQKQNYIFKYPQIKHALENILQENYDEDK